MSENAYDLMLPLWYIREEEWHAFPASIVDVAPHITVATWAVHRSPDDPQGWGVSNIETGYHIVVRARSRRAAINEARDRLDKKTDADCIDAFSKLATECTS